MNFSRHTSYIIVPFIMLLSILLFSCKKDVLYPAETTEVATGAISDINNIIFINDTLGYIAGGEKYLSSELLTTTDGGKTWNRFFKNNDGSKTVNGIAYNGSKIIAAGYGGQIYTPKANSDDWAIVPTQYYEWFQNLTFPTPNKGFIVSGEGYALGNLFHIDSSLNVTLAEAYPYQLCDIHFADEQTGFMCGYGVVLKTVDGGTNWNLQNIKGDFYRSMSIIDAQNVWIAGYNGSIIHTSNGGKHWEKQRNGDNPLLDKYRFRGIKFKDLNTGYAVGDAGLIVKTVDGGVHWSLFKQTTNKDLKCITLHPDGSLWIGGSDGLVLHIKE